MRCVAATTPPSMRRATPTTATASVRRVAHSPLTSSSSGLCLSRESRRRPTTPSESGIPTALLLAMPRLTSMSMVQRPLLAKKSQLPTTPSPQSWVPTRRLSLGRPTRSTQSSTLSLSRLWAMYSRNTSVSTPRDGSMTTRRTWTSHSYPIRQSRTTASRMAAQPALRASYRSSHSPGWSC